MSRRLYSGNVDDWKNEAIPLWRELLLMLVYGMDGMGGLDGMD